METLRDLFDDTLKDVYFAENAILKALPKMAKAAHAKDLKAALSAHLEETKGQIKRLESIFGMLGVKPAGKECPAILGLIEEGEELISAKPEPAVLDAGVLGAAQAVEHYEMARYGTLRAWADQLGLGEVAKLLEQTLAEEKATDAKLSALALGGINTHADDGNDRLEIQDGVARGSGDAASHSAKPAQRQKSAGAGR